MSKRCLSLMLVAAAAIAVVIAWYALTRKSSATGAAAEPDDIDAVTLPVIDRQRAAIEPASISGSVLSRDQRGAAISGARVCAWLIGDERRVVEALAARCRLTDADGRYRLEPLEPGRYRVSASAAGKLPAVWKGPDEAGGEILHLGANEARTKVDIALAQGGLELSGVVLDVSGGPIEGALVVGIKAGLFAREPTATATSDEQGRFSMWVAGGEHSLRAVAEGYAPGIHQAQAPNRNIELWLTPESVLVGRVVDARSGAGIAGVSVTANAGPYARPIATSSADGSFQLGGLAPGIYQPEAIGSGVYGRAASPVHVGLGQISEPIELRVHAAHRLRGRIVAVDHRRPEQERGCARGWVRLGGAGVQRNAVPDDDGWVVLEGLPAGRHELGVACADAAQGSALERVLDLRGDLDEQRWPIDVAGISIRGRAVDDRGRGVELVYIDSTGPGGGAHDLTPAGGEFELRVREAGTHRITARLKGQGEPVATVELEVHEAAVEDVELVIGEVAAVCGRVEDPDGNPVPGVRVALCDAKGRPRHWAMSDGEGGFGFDAQPPGRAWIALADEIAMDRDEPVGEPVELRGDRVAELVRTIEARRGSIRGTVTTAGGPVDDAWIVAGRGPSDALVRDWEVGPVLCDLDGSFELDSLGEGTWAIRAYRRDGDGEASLDGVELGASVELPLAETASVVGRVGHRDGSAPEHFEIEARSSERRRSHAFYRSEGAFELAGLSAGTWTLRIVAESGAAELELELVAGQRLVGLEVELEPRVTILGRAVDSRTKAPVTSVEITHQYSRGFRRKARPSEDGKFELAGLPPGRVELIVSPRDWRSASYSLQVPVIELAAEPLVQDIGELELVGGELEPGQSPGELGFEFRISGGSEGLEGADDWQVEVTKLRLGGPAEVAGLRVGDVITRFDGASVEGRQARGMGIYMRKVAAGAKITIERRDDTKLSIVAAPSG
ncbi:MAG: carboxypeptidase regulatory-like domain-containing protein [Enhygromyxa sp.]